MAANARIDGKVGRPSVCFFFYNLFFFLFCTSQKYSIEIVLLVTGYNFRAADFSRTFPTLVLGTGSCTALCGILGRFYVKLSLGRP